MAARQEQYLTRVMHVVDTLARGGTERVAATLSGLGARRGLHTHLCTTRSEGPLAMELPRTVGRLELSRKTSCDIPAVRKLVRYIQAQRIELLHAHSSSVFIAAAASLFPPYPALVWHDHYGNHGVRKRNPWAFRLVRPRIDAVIAVSESLAQWSVEQLGMTAQRVFFVPNCATLPPGQELSPDLPGRRGYRIVCAANLRPQKDHLTLIRAMRAVAARVPAAHLLLAGAIGDAAYAAAVRQEVERCKLQGQVTFLGSRPDLGGVLRACDIGVLSSRSEGLPLALLEYGMSGLAVVVTDVGQCSDVVDGGRAGLVVPPSDPDALAVALVTLLEESSRRSCLAGRFGTRVRERYSDEVVMDQVTLAYRTALRHREGYGDS